jgi:hypothetical protein
MVVVESELPSRVADRFYISQCISYFDTSSEVDN